MDQAVLLNKLLWKSRSKWLMLGAIAGAFIGLWLLLASVQFYVDVNYLLKGDADPGDQYVQVNKKINVFNTLGMKAAFTSAEVEDFRRQPFVEEVGEFTANDFKAGAYSDMLGFYTELFFESVPNDFLDVGEPKFRWSTGQTEVPVLISRDYLALYNFGFAPSQGLPQITPATISKLQMEIRVSGNGRQQSFAGRIVGFSDRINSILVPPAFMQWANGEFGAGGGDPSRLILKVKNPLDKGFQAFLKEKNYEISTGRLIGSQFGVLFKVVLSVMLGMGLLILALSMLVFVLNFQVLVAQRAPEIRLLMETGHFPREIIQLMSKRFFLLFGGVVVLALLALLVGRYFEVQILDRQGFAMNAGLSPLVWALWAGLAALLLFLNFFNIRHSVQQLA